MQTPVSCDKTSAGDARRQSVVSQLISREPLSSLGKRSLCVIALRNLCKVGRLEWEGNGLLELRLLRCVIVPLLLSSFPLLKCKTMVRA